MAAPAAVLATTKTCTRCGEAKQRSEFRARKGGSRDGLHGWCNPCYNAYYSKASREWRRSNRERDRRNKRRMYAANAERERARMQRYREANYERVRALENKRRREAYALDPTVVLARNQRRRAGVVAETLEVTAHIALIRQQPCTYCGSTGAVAVDHVVPLARGGSHEVENLVSACRSCNSSKKDLLLSEWRVA